MAYDRQSLILTWTFAIIGTDELAVTTIHASGSTSFDSVAGLAGLSTADLDALNSAMQTMMADGSLLWADFSTYTGIKVAALDVAGHYLAAPVVRAPVTPSSGSATGPIYAQDSVVLSVRSPTTFGEANRGRLYLPHCGINRAAATPFMTGGNVGTFATACQVFLNAVNDVLNTGSDPSVIQIMSSKGSGTSKAITSMAVGNVCDTQRRRRNRLAENYTTRTVSP